MEKAVLLSRRKPFLICLTRENTAVLLSPNWLDDSTTLDK